jgi:peroxiredoxin
LNVHAEQLMALGYGLATISYDNTEVLKTFAEQKSISYSLLFDQRVQTMLVYDIVNNEYDTNSAH